MKSILQLHVYSSTTWVAAVLATVIIQLLLEHESHHSSNHVAYTIKDVVQWGLAIHVGRGRHHSVGFIRVRLLQQTALLVKEN